MRLPRKADNGRRWAAALFAALWATLLTTVSPAESEAQADSVAPAGAAAGSTTLDFANGLYARRMYEPAISEYEKFMRDNPKAPELADAKFRYADSYYFTRNYEASIHYFGEFEKEFPRDVRVPMARFRVATARFHTGKPRAAAQALSKLVSDASAGRAVRSGALYYLGKSHEASGNAKSASAAFEKLVTTDPASEYASLAAVALGDRALAEGDLERAAAAYRVAADKPTPPEMSVESGLKLADIHFSRKEFAEATGRYGQLLARVVEERQFPEALRGRLKQVRDQALLGLFACAHETGDAAGADRLTRDNAATIASSDRGPEMRFLYASLLVDRSRAEEALPILEVVLAEPNLSNELHDNAALEKARALSSLKRSDGALEEIQKLLTGTAGNRPRALYEKGKLLEEAQRDAEAADVYERLTRETSEGPYARAGLYRLALLRLKLGDGAAARERFLQYVERNPGDPNAASASLAVMQIDLDAKRFDEAAKSAKGFLAQFPSDKRSDLALYKLGVAQTGLKQFDDAAQSFRSVLERVPESEVSVEATYGLAASLENAGKPRDAIPYYEKIVRFHVDHPLAAGVLSRLGTVYIRADQYRKAAEFFEESLLRRPGASIAPDGFFWLIQYLLNRGEYAKLKNVAEALPARFPDQDLRHEVQFFLGESAMGSKDYAAAVESYTQSIAARIDGAYVPHARLGTGIASAALGDRERAAKEFEAALHSDSDPKVSMRARFEIANLEVRAGRLTEAAKAFMLVAILYDDPKYASQSLYRAAECFRKLGRDDEAQKAVEELFTRYPKSSWAKKALDEVPSGAAKPEVRS